MSNAERQKRYRDMKRNAPVTESVSFAPHNVTRKSDQSVTRVTVEPERNALEHVPADELMRRLNYIREGWKTSPEHIEIMRRLNTYTVAELEAQGQWVPCWKYEQERAA